MSAVSAPVRDRVAVTVLRGHCVRRSQLPVPASWARVDAAHRVLSVLHGSASLGDEGGPPAPVGGWASVVFAQQRGQGCPGGSPT